MTDEIIDKYSKTVYRLAFARTKNRADAEDITQEVFLSYLKNAPVFIDEEHEKAWFLKVTVNKTNSLFSSAWFRKTEQLDENLSSPEKSYLSEVLQAVMRLTEKYRTVIHLFYYEDLSVSQISEVLSLKQTTIKSQLSRAREMLKDYLSEEDYYVQR